MLKIDYPPWLQPGDRLSVIAPSGNLRNQDDWQAGLDIWRDHGYKLEISEQCYLTTGYLAGTDEQRRQALKTAWLDPDCRGILCARGGYGAMRLLEHWQWNQQDSYIPKWLIGFSDVTALLWSLAKSGIASVHGPVITTIASEPEWSIERLFKLVSGEKLPPLVGQGWGGGQATGLLLPGNLTVATHLLNTSLHPPLDEVILAVEEVAEVPYRIDRLLTQWRLLGLLSQVKGIALGRFSGCDAPSHISSWTAKEVLRDRLGDLNIPIVGDLPFGHRGANAALIVGERVVLDGEKGTLTQT